MPLEITRDQYLFALLLGADGFEGNPGENLAYALGKLKGIGNPGRDPGRFLRLRRTGAGKPLPLPSEALPLLVTLNNIADPSTVTVVDPDNLAATFGPGVTLLSVTVELTEEPMTEGIIRTLVLDSPGYKALSPIWQDIAPETKNLLTPDLWKWQ